MARDRRRDRPRFDSILAAIEAGNVQRVYVLYGANTQQIEEALRGLKAAVVGEEDAFAAYQVFRGDEAKGVEIVNAARTVPMLADEQLIVVRRADALAASEQAVLLPYFESPTPSTCLVLIATKLDKRLKLWSRANKLGYVFEAAAAQERDLSAFISNRARARGLKMSPAVAHLIGETTGTDPTTIEDALERLGLFVGEGGAIENSDVEAVVSSSRVHSIFELTDALGRRDVSAALSTLTNMLANREAPLRILATLATHMRRLLHASELGGAALGNPNQLASELGLPSFLARKVADQTRQFSRGELRAAMRRLAATDLELKGSKRPDELILEEMVLALCLGRPRVDRAARNQLARR